jgi:hypothetical protein
MRFISLSTLKKVCGEIVFPLSQDKLSEIRTLLYANEAFAAIDMASKEYLLEALLSEKNLLFYQWIEEHKNLRELLENGMVKDVFEDKLHWSKHALYPEFKGFIAPFLKDLPPFTNLNNWDDLNKALSYHDLLPPTNREQVYQATIAYSSQERNRVKALTERCKSDQALFECLQSEIPDAVWSALNHLPVVYYSERVAWLEFLMQLAYHPKSSRRLMLFIHKLVANLSLKKEHDKQVEDQHKALMSGSYAFEKTRISWKRLTVAIAVVIGFVGIMVGLWFIPSEPEVDTSQEETSFMSFSPEERKQLDSLLSAASQQERQKLQETIGEDALPEAPAQLVFRQHWENVIFGTLYTKWSQNDSIASSAFLHSGKTTKTPYSGTRPLDQRHGEKEVNFTNNTSMNTLIIVFENKRKAPVFTRFVSPRSQINFTINESDIILVLPGGKVFEDGNFGDLPFREVDQRFFTKMNEIYEVREMGPKKLRLVWESVSQTEMYLVDLTSGLERY